MLSCEKRKQAFRENEYVYTLIVCFIQAQDSGVPEVLNIIRSNYGGRIHERPPAKDDTQRRTRWALVIERNEGNLTMLLMHLSKHCVLKSKQAAIALNFLNDLNNGNVDKFEEYYNEMKRLKELIEYRKVEIDTTRITPNWLAGFFDAEGSVAVYNRSLRLVFTQKSSLSLLRAINNYFQSKHHVHGWIHEKDSYFLVYCSRSAAIVIEDLLMASPTVKRKQLELAKRYQQLQSLINGKRQKNTKKERDEIAQELVRLKVV